jgi:type I restriction enzyme S subunit
MKVLPKNWTLIPLGDCCQIISGSTPKRNKPEYWGGDIPWVTPKDLSKLKTPVLEDAPEKITEAGYKSCSTTLLPQGSILFSSRAPIGHVAIAGRPMCTNQGFKSLVPNKFVHSPYLYWCMRQYASDVEALGSGTTFKEVSKGIVERFKIPLPPLEEQRRIAAILDKADEVRRKRKEAIRLTEELLKSTFLDLFGDPVTNPKGWDITELQNVCHRVTDGTHQPPHWADEGIPFLFVSNIINGEIDFKVSKYITEESWSELTSRCPIEINDILYTTVGSYGNAALVRTKKHFCFQRHIAHIKPDSQSIEPEFLLGMMQSDSIRQQADKQARGVAQKTLNLRELKKFTIFTPPIEEQKKYVKLRQGIEKQLSYYQSTLEESENLFNSLLQRAFRGEL